MRVSCRFGRVVHCLGRARSRRAVTTCTAPIPDAPLAARARAVGESEMTTEVRVSLSTCCYQPAIVLDGTVVL